MSRCSSQLVCEKGISDLELRPTRAASTNSMWTPPMCSAIKSDLCNHLIPFVLMLSRIKLYPVPATTRTALNPDCSARRNAFSSPAIDGVPSPNTRQRQQPHIFSDAANNLGIIGLISTPKENKPLHWELFPFKIPLYSSWLFYIHSKLLEIIVNNRFIEWTRWMKRVKNKCPANITASILPNMGFRHFKKPQRPPHPYKHKKEFQSWGFVFWPPTENLFQHKEGTFWRNYTILTFLLSALSTLNLKHKQYEIRFRNIHHSNITTRGRAKATSLR